MNRFADFQRTISQFFSGLFRGLLSGPKRKAIDEIDDEVLEALASLTIGTHDSVDLAPLGVVRHPADRVGHELLGNAGREEVDVPVPRGGKFSTCPCPGTDSTS